MIDTPKSETPAGADEGVEGAPSGAADTTGDTGNAFATRVETLETGGSGTTSDRRAPTSVVGQSIASDPLPSDRSSSAAAAPGASTDAAPDAAPAAQASAGGGDDVPKLAASANSAAQRTPDPAVPRTASSGAPRMSRRRSRPPPLQLDPGNMQSATEDESESEWVPMQSRTQGRPYFYHTGTKETVWEKPPGFEAELPEGTVGWVEMESRTQGRYYYYNQRTKECTWDRPSGVPEPPPFERKQLDPRREYLRTQINVWAEEFMAANGREPSEDDIPAGSDIALMHRDYRMLKEEAEYDRLKKEQGELRKELDPNSRDRLREIRDRLTQLEGPVEDWRVQKEKERERREKVTTLYNSWIKQFTEARGRAPTEKDIPTGSDISAMFREYQRYREDARKAKARAAKGETSKNKGRFDQDEHKVRQWIAEFESEHGRKPTRRDLPKGGDIARLYTEFISRQGNESPGHSQKDKLQAKLTAWTEKFTKSHGRAPDQDDIDDDAEASALHAEIQKMSREPEVRRAKKEGMPRRSVTRPRGDSRKASTRRPAGPLAGPPSGIPSGRQEEEDWQDLSHDIHSSTQMSPSAAYRYDSVGRPARPGCGDCCLIM